MAFKDWLKSKPYWLKGTISTLMILFIFSFIISITITGVDKYCMRDGAGTSYYDTCNNAFEPFIFSMLSITEALNIIFLIIEPFLDCSWFACLYISIYTEYLSYILISIIVGLIYGKIKSKK